MYKQLGMKHWRLKEATAELTRSKFVLEVKKKYFEHYVMIGNISIDGFKRERYIQKVKDFEDEIEET